MLFNSFTPSPMIFKILDQARDCFFELTVIIVKNQPTAGTRYERLLEPWEMRIYFNIASHTDDSIDVSAVFYRELKKHDIYNTCSLEMTYDADMMYDKEVITFQHEPVNFAKFLQQSGFRCRMGLNPDFDFQEQMDEYTCTFKDIKYLDTFLDQLKYQLKDSSNAELNIKDLKYDNATAVH